MVIGGEIAVFQFSRWRPCGAPSCIFESSTF